MDNEWVIVPIEPTIAMLEKLTQEWHPDRQRPFRERYKAMLSAAPRQQAVAILKINEHGEYSLELPYSVDSEEAYAEFVNGIGGPGEYKLCLMISPHPIASKTE